MIRIPPLVPASKQATCSPGFAGKSIVNKDFGLRKYEQRDIVNKNKGIDTFSIPGCSLGACVHAVQMCIGASGVPLYFPLPPSP